MAALLQVQAEEIHPDTMVYRCLWYAAPRIAPSTRTSGTITRYAPQCGCGSTTWVPRTMDGKGKNKRKLPRPVPVCASCGAAWDTWDVDDHMRTGVSGSGVTRRGRWCRYIHVRGEKRPGRSTELRIFGGVDLHQVVRARAIAETLHRSPRWRWAIRCYFEYVLHYKGVRGRGGQASLAEDARQRWNRAPFAWNVDRVADLIKDARHEWATRLAEAGVIRGGGWWLDEETESESSP